MLIPPPVNPDVHEIADQVKEGFAVGTQLIAAVQYRLGELAGTGRLDPEESLRLQEVLVGIWEVLYCSTLCALHDYGSDLTSWDETDNTYSDGRVIKTTTRIEPVEESDEAWRHNRFTLGDGAVAEAILGEVTYIAPAPSTPTSDGQPVYQALLDMAGRLEEGGIPFRPGRPEL